jgi:flagellar FliJ protein
MSLDALRKLRARTEEAVTMELAQLTQELLHLEQRCETLDAKIQSDASVYRSQVEQGMSVHSMLEWQGYLDSQRSDLQQARGAIGRLTEAWAGVQTRLIEATQDRKVLDRLAERQWEAHKAGILRREQQATDEAASRRPVLGKESI